MYRLLVALLLALSSVVVHAQTSAAKAVPPATTQTAPVMPMLEDFAKDDDIHVAPVELDGEVLFRVRGVAAQPAKVRASRIRARLIEVAENEAIDPGDIEAILDNGMYRLEIGGEEVAILLGADAQLERVPLEILVAATTGRLEESIIAYRDARSSTKLARSTAMLAGITLVAALLLYLTSALFGWLDRLVERVVKRRIEHIERASHRIIDAAQLWSWLGGLLRGIKILSLIGIVLTWLNTALGLYPWTRPFATGIFELILNPLQKIGKGFVSFLPDFVFLVVLFFIVRFILSATKTFFERVDRGWIRFNNFDRDWAMPTFRIVRVLIIAFSVVVAYPYIPGSESDAFKGVSIFLGLVFSIGSSSFIANMLAGYSLTYRGAFREGDRVRIGDHLGEVVAVRALSTTLRSPKNEEINISNSEVLTSAVINYSAYQKADGLIVHTEVGIGYDTPWRQVEALLLEAAARTPGVDSSREPFVLQMAMGDFAVVYQLNVTCRDATKAIRLASDLNAAIQDVFNEYGVQIMSPHYESDPPDLKLVPPDKWYPAPAKPPEE